MKFANIICRSHCLLILLMMAGENVVAGEHYFQNEKRACDPAEAEPTFRSSTSCYPLVNFPTPFCQNQGVSLDSHVFRSPDSQIQWNNEANRDAAKILNLDATFINKHLKILNVSIATFNTCKSAFSIYFCRNYFPRCDRTKSVFQKQMVCRESCHKLTGMCGKLFDIFFNVYSSRFPEPSKEFNCTLKPYRNAGDTPECWYYNEHAKIPDTSSKSQWNTKADCLHFSGTNYHGNIAVTASGITCQSWREQCPHRHTMNTTYPELNFAENYCRNPHNSGKRPWCFTTDAKKRWEYCNIPKCIPVDGNYGNWSLNGSCNATCGEGFETWHRECNNPEPKYGGRNCSHLGLSVEYRPCEAIPCPINGGFGNWSLAMSCSVSCGKGVEKWERVCNNPEPKYGGHNCSEVGDSTEYRNCTRAHCPNPLNLKMIGIPIGATLFLTAAFFLVLRRYRRKKGSRLYSGSNSITRNLDIPLLQEPDNQNPEENAILSQESEARYCNEFSDGNPLPGRSRGIVPYRSDYVNDRLFKNLRYDRLQVLLPIVIDWLRNAWGNVDEFGRNTYDAMHPSVRQVFSPYDKSAPQSDLAKSASETSFEIFDRLKRPEPLVLPAGSANLREVEFSKDTSLPPLN